MNGRAIILIRPAHLADDVQPLLFPDVRDYSLWETVILATLIAFGVAFLTWLLAGYYERRGGFGKK